LKFRRGSRTPRPCRDWPPPFRTRNFQLRSGWSNTRRRCRLSDRSGADSVAFSAVFCRGYD